MRSHISYSAAAADRSAELLPIWFHKMPLCLASPAGERMISDALGSGEKSEISLNAAAPMDYISRHETRAG